MYTDSEDEEEEINYSAQTEVPMVAATQADKPYHKNYNANGKAITAATSRTSQTVQANDREVERKRAS